MGRKKHGANVQALDYCDLFFYISSPREELEKIFSKQMQGFNQSKEDYVKNVHDDVIFLPPNEPIITGKQGKAKFIVSKLV